MKHVHAELLKLYSEQLIAWVAAGADIEKHPANDWEWFSYRDSHTGEVWIRCDEVGAPAFLRNLKYRYNPRPKTVTRYLNDGTEIKLPEPCKEKLPEYWTISPAGSVFDIYHNLSNGDRHFAIGNYYRTKSDAQKWARYLKHIRTGEPMEIANESNC